MLKTQQFTVIRCTPEQKQPLPKFKNKTDQPYSVSDSSISKCSLFFDFNEKTKIHFIEIYNNGSPFVSFSVSNEKSLLNSEELLPKTRIIKDEDILEQKNLNCRRLFSLRNFQRNVAKLEWKYLAISLSKQPEVHKNTILGLQFISVSVLKKKTEKLKVIELEKKKVMSPLKNRKAFKIPSSLVSFMDNNYKEKHLKLQQPFVRKRNLDEKENEQIGEQDVLHTQKKTRVLPKPPANLEIDKIKNKLKEKPKKEKNFEINNKQIIQKNSKPNKIIINKDTEKEKEKEQEKEQEKEREKEQRKRKKEKEKEKEKVKVQEIEIIEIGLGIEKEKEKEKKKEKENERGKEKEKEKEKEKVKKTIQNRKNQNQKVKVNINQNKNKNTNKKKNTNNPPQQKKRRRRKNINEILKNVKFTVLGIQNPEKTNLKNMGVELGAEYFLKWKPKQNMYVICNQNLQTPNFLEATKGRAKILISGWMEDCYKYKKRQVLRPYILIEYPKGRTANRGKKKNESEEESDFENDEYDFNDGFIVKDNDSDHAMIVEQDEEFNVSRDESETDDLEFNDDIDDDDDDDDDEFEEYKHLIPDYQSSRRKFDLVDFDLQKILPNYFSNKTFWIQEMDYGFKRVKFLKRIIITCGGVIVNNNAGSANYLISRAKLLPQDCSLTGQNIRATWVFRSYKEKRLLPLRKYLF
ncbi:DNA-repair protein xrcc1 [Anaeramoeba flamelloides]|uniref:DNA-repair protein xrcc1 n=1 Tax=Anaeramoeba flamelloides TaxID=1746091 RepID=A0ABQ8XRX2_9EUKA|nr:DNA-repair protein xrcc1 [Anaeramoeba flamelloides]